MMSVSVVIPCKNRIEYLQRAIHSVLQQTLAPEHIIVVDDGSEPSIASQLDASLLTKLQIIRNERSQNAAFSRNLGVAHCDTPYVAFLDSDDQWLPNHLAQALAVLQQYPHALYITPTKPQAAPRIIEQPLQFLFEQGGDFRSSGFVCERTTFDDFQGFDEQLAKHQDWDLTLRAGALVSLVLGQKNTLLLDVTAPQRMSASANIEASQRFYTRHQTTMSEPQQRVFLSGIARSCVLNYDLSALHELQGWLAQLQRSPQSLGLLGMLCCYLPQCAYWLLRLNEARRSRLARTEISSHV